MADGSPDEAALVAGTRAQVDIVEGVGLTPGTMFLSAMRGGAAGAILFGGAFGCAVAALACFSFETTLSGRMVRDKADEGAGGVAHGS